MCADKDGEMPILYLGEASVTSDDVIIEKALVNITNVDYLDWHTSLSSRFVEYLDDGAEDTVAFFPLKSGWLAHSGSKNWSCDTFVPSKWDECDDTDDPYKSSCGGYAPLSACAGYREGELESGVRKWVELFHKKRPTTFIMTNENPSGFEKFSWASMEFRNQYNVIGEIRPIENSAMCLLYPETGPCKQ